MAISSSKPEGSARMRYCPTINRPRMRFPRRSAADRSCMIVLKWSFSVPQLAWFYSEQTKTHSRNLLFALLPNLLLQNVSTGAAVCPLDIKAIDTRSERASVRQARSTLSITSFFFLAFLLSTTKGHLLIQVRLILYYLVALSCRLGFPNRNAGHPSPAINHQSRALLPSRIIRI
jgi:hypothetical protein